MSNFDILKELIKERIEHEKENYAEAKKYGGMDCSGAGQALGAIDAYHEMLADIAELVQEVRETP